MQITDFFENKWVVGTLCSIWGALVLLIISYIISLLFKTKHSKLYVEKISSANKEILSSVKLLIIENETLSRDIFDALKSSISKKYEVDAADLLCEKSIKDELIGEVMLNSFLNAEHKVKFCNTFNSLFEEDKKENDPSANAQKANNSHIISLLFGSFYSLFLYVYLQFCFNALDIEVTNVTIPCIVFGLISIIGLAAYIKNRRNESLAKKKAYEALLNDKD